MDQFELADYLIKSTARSEKNTEVPIYRLREERGMMRWAYGAVDGAFSPWAGGKSAQVLLLLHAVKVQTGRRGRPRTRLRVLATEKGDDAKTLRHPLRKRGIRAQIPQRVWKTKNKRGRPSKKTVPRCQAERTCAWFQKTDRRLVVRWERIAACFEAFLAIATIHIWLPRLIVG